jgi:hypothetical protein
MKRGLDMLANLTARNPTAADVIDRVLDKGIVVDCLVDRVSLSGIDLPVTVNAGFIVTSLDTYLERVQYLEHVQQHTKSGFLRETDAWLQDMTIR